MGCARAPGSLAGVSDFTELLADLDYPMMVVTTYARGERAGCLVGFATQTSIHPGRFLVCLSRENHTYRVARYAQLLGVHFVPVKRADIAELFGGETGDEIDKFARCDWHEGPGGVPLLDGLPNRFVGRIVARWDAGDHEAQLLEPVHAERATRAEEFRFQRAKRIQPGHPA
jgi:flavin reductase (DIM6/NTAB) family NADH-FMN oxidoreductase RutF